MDFRFTAEQEKFRQELRHFLQREVTPELLEELEARGEEGYSREFTQQVARKGWIGLAWPKEYGGQGLGYIERLIYNEEMVYRKAPWGYHFFGDRQHGPSFIAAGTEKQKKTYLPRITSGEAGFCVGYTEPGAGSDLASVQTRAVADGDDFVINGQKMYTSGAHYSDHIWLATRTNPDVPKHKGISILIVDMKLPGVAVRPLITMDGGRTNEVFFDDVRVSKDCLVGEKDRGWYIMAANLDYERSGIERVTEYLRLFEGIVQFVRDASRDNSFMCNPIVENKLAEMSIEFRVGQLLAYRVAWMQSQELIPNYEASMSKVFGSELSQRVANVGMQVMGLYGQLEKGSKWAQLQGRIERTYLRSVSDTVRGGSSEIQRNIIATRGLELPR